MATTLNKVQQERRAAAALPVGKTLSKERLAPIGKESELCDLYIRDFNNVSGWTCYPETAGFDILVVHQDGRQIGVEAKLSLNRKSRIRFCRVSMTTCMVAPALIIGW